MKLFNNIFLILFAAFLYTSCEKEVIVDMDNSAGMKVQQTIDHYTKELTEASYGWIVDVKTNEGYYQFLMHFTDDNFVKMYTDNLNYPDLNGKPKESTYNFRSLQRITLSFDTYSYLAIINDPDNSISGGTNNQGLVTDFDFEIDNYTNGIFTMTGRINRVPAKMRRATVAEKVAVENGGLMNSLRNLLSYKPDRYTYFSANGADVSVIFSGRMMDIAYFDREGTLVETTADLNIRPTFDIELPEYFNINGADLTGFRWDAAKGEFSAVVESRRYELETGDRSVIPFYKLFGLNRTDTYMTTSIDIFYANNSNMILRYIIIISNFAIIN